MGQAETKLELHKTGSFDANFSKVQASARHPLLPDWFISTGNGPVDWKQYSKVLEDENAKLEYEIAQMDQIYDQLQERKEIIDRHLADLNDTADKAEAFDESRPYPSLPDLPLTPRSIALMNHRERMQEESEKLRLVLGSKPVAAVKPQANTTEITK